MGLQNHGAGTIDRWMTEMERSILTDEDDSNGNANSHGKEYVPPHKRQDVALTRAPGPLGTTPSNFNYTTNFNNSARVTARSTTKLLVSTSTTDFKDFRSHRNTTSASSSSPSKSNPNFYLATSSSSRKSSDAPSPPRLIDESSFLLGYSWERDQVLDKFRRQFDEEFAKNEMAKAGWDFSRTD
ncbi:hypothetical protein B7494_g728 [Chlorociboria aeruginascens]|nr:hypothetical protein B7494_g728 [Chlorociboria aeruginascens]